MKETASSQWPKRSTSEKRIMVRPAQPCSMRMRPRSRKKAASTPTTRDHGPQPVARQRSVAEVAPRLAVRLHELARLLVGDRDLAAQALAHLLPHLDVVVAGPLRLHDVGTAGNGGAWRRPHAGARLLLLCVERRQRQGERQSRAGQHAGDGQRPAAADRTANEARHHCPILPIVAPVLRASEPCGPIVPTSAMSCQSGHATHR